jgi:hypothetical protein
MLRRAGQLLLSELRYFQRTLLVGYGCFFALALLFALHEHSPEAGFTVGPSLGDEFGLLMWLVLAGHVYWTFKTISVDKAERRLRFLLPLPVTRTEIALARLGRTVILPTFTLLLLGFWLLLFVDVTQFRLGRSLSGAEELGFWDVVAVKEVILWIIACVLVLSLILSFFILLLESRRNRPLLKSWQWLILLVVAVGVFVPFLGVRNWSTLDRMLFGLALGRRWIGLPRPDIWGEVLVPFLPVALLVAVLLGYEYFYRVRGGDTDRE